MCYYCFYGSFLTAVFAIVSSIILNFHCIGEFHNTNADVSPKLSKCIKREALDGISTENKSEVRNSKSYFLFVASCNWRLVTL